MRRLRTARAVRRGPTLVALAVAASVLAVPAVFALQSEGSAQSDADAKAATIAYYQSVRQSMAPLVQHVREFPASLRALASPDATVSPALTTSIATWEGDYATARDLVRRLTPPAGTTGSVEAARLYETGAMLYVEAARSASAASKASAPGPRKAIAVKAERLGALGDRMFDSAFRLLNVAGAISPSELRFPAAVPGDVDGLEPPAGPVVGPSSQPPAPADAWTRAHTADLARLAGMARATSSTRTELDSAQRRLAAPVSDVAAQEAVNGLRLAVLVVGESAADGPENRGVPDQSARLALIGTRLWNSVLGLLGSASGFADAAALTLPLASSEDLLLEGGAFDGHPPALNPGDPVDKGLPGGLPVLDPMALIGQQ